MSSPVSRHEGATAAQSATERTEEILRRFHEESSFEESYDWNLVRKLWVYVRPQSFLLTVSLSLGVLIAGGGLLRPWLMQWAIDDGVMGKNADVLFQGAAAFAVVTVGEQILQIVRIYATQLLGVRVVAQLREALFTFLHTLRMRFFDQQPVGRLVTRVTNDTDALLELTASGALSIFTDCLKLAGVVVMMLLLDWQLALVSFLSVPVVALLVRQVRKFHRQAFRDIRAKTSRMNATMNEQVSGMTVVQAFGRQKAAEEEFDVINESYREANIRSIKYDAMQDAAVEMVTAMSLSSILVAATWHPVSFGILVAFNAYVKEFFEPISMLAQRYTIFQSSMAGAERIFQLLEVDEPDAPALPAKEDGDTSLQLELDQVEFCYKEGAPVLNRISLSARPGEKIAVVGPTGSGKTTIASLLLRLYDVQDGTVRVGGRDVRAYDRTELRRQFAVVPQDVFLFPGTLAQNVAAGQTPDISRVEEVLRRIKAWDLLTQREGGVLATVEERGHNFSAGERQLIAFARALYRDAPVLILDEATASVDSDTEARLQQAVDQLMTGRTALIIAHRLSTIRAADRIVVLRAGTVAEQGTHEELMALQGIYARLYRLHFAKRDKSS